MKRLSQLIPALMVVVPMLNAQDKSNPMMSVATLDLKNCNVLRMFSHLWKIHPLGEAETGTWIVISENGRYRQIDWSYAPQHHKATWSGVLPDNIVAQLHTHGEEVDPRPSGPDSLIAKRLNICVYTVSRKGIWRVSPEGTVTRETEHSWFQESRRRCTTALWHPQYYLR